MSCNLNVAITWRNSENIRICKREKYAISWQNHEDNFFNKYRLPKVLCLSFCLAHFALVFFTELRVKRSKPEQPRKIVIIKHRVFASFSFFASFGPLGHLCSRDNSIQGTLNLVPEKSSHNICSCYLYWSDNSIQGKGALFLGLNLPFNQRKRKIWLATKRLYNM